MSSAISKMELRDRIRTRLEQISALARADSSQSLRRLLEQQNAWKNAQRILFYAPLPDEPDVWPLFEDALQTGKEACLPKFIGGVKETGAGTSSSSGEFPLAHHYAACAVRELSRDLKTGQFGIREPADACPLIPLNRLDFVLVPGVAFDLQGRRLGRGKGYYDRLLAEVRGKTCGVAFDEQIVEELPLEPHDVLVNCILTPTRWIEL